MKIISCSVVDILPALLDKSKTQTIRPAWYDKLTCFWCQKKFKNLVEHNKKAHSKLTPRSYDFHGKPTRFKVKEKVQLMWKQRCPYKKFCKICGKGAILHNSKLDNHTYVEFDKKLGEGEITEVFKIKIQRLGINMDTKQGGFLWIFVKVHGYNEWQSVTEYMVRSISKRDGFKSVDDFWNYFKKAGEYWVYRWKWL